MPEIGSLEILVVAAVAFVVFGPERLPQLARQVGKYASQFRRMVSEVKDEFSMELDDDEARPRRPTRARKSVTGGSDAKGSDAKSSDAGDSAPTGGSQAAPADSQAAPAGSQASPPPGDTTSSPES